MFGYARVHRALHCLQEFSEVVGVTRCSHTFLALRWGRASYMRLVSDKRDEDLHFRCTDKNRLLVSE